MSTETKIDFNDPQVVADIRAAITEDLHQYLVNPDSMPPEEAYGYEVAIKFYPNDHTKQVNLIYCMTRATMETMYLKNESQMTHACEEILIPLATELDVLDPFVTEILEKRIIHS